MKKIDSKAFAKLPSCSEPRNLQFSGLALSGLREFVLAHREIRIPASLVPQHIQDTELFRYATFSEDAWKKIHYQILNDEYENWDYPMTYIRNCEGISTGRLAIIIFAATGQLPPPELLCAIKFLAEVLIPGSYVMNGIEHNGSSLVPIETFFAFVGAWNSGSADTIDPYAVLGCLKEFISVVKDNMGKAKWMGEKDTIVGEAGLMAVSGLECDWEIDIPPESVDFNYTDEQKTAINGVLSSKRLTCCITGAGGTGKTTVLRRIVQGFNRGGISVLAMAPTGAAVVRMRQQIGDLIDNNAIGTIHRFIYARKEEITDLIAKCSVVVIDECSMMDSRTFGKFLLALSRLRKNNDTVNLPRFVFSGDYVQLPPVGAGEGFSDLIELNACPAFRLTTVMRTSNPEYLSFFDKVRNNASCDPRKAFEIMEATKETLPDVVDSMVEKIYETHGDRWWEKTAVIGFRNVIIDRINIRCYSRLVGRDYPVPRLFRTDETGSNKLEYCHWGAVGCRVMFTSNDSELGVVNGDVGTVLGSEDDIYTGKKLTKIQLDTGDVVEINEKYSSIKLGWARTVHKAQGSEYENVWYIHENWLETRRLVYTSVTRAKKNLSMVLVNPKNFKMEADRRRHTAIKQGMTAWNSLNTILLRSLRAERLESKMISKYPTEYSAVRENYENSEYEAEHEMIPLEVASAPVCEAERPFDFDLDDLPF